MRARYVRMSDLLAGGSRSKRVHLDKTQKAMDDVALACVMHDAESACNNDETCTWVASMQKCFPKDYKQEHSPFQKLIRALHGVDLHENKVTLNTGEGVIQEIEASADIYSLIHRRMRASGWRLRTFRSMVRFFENNFFVQKLCALVVLGSDWWRVAESVFFVADGAETAVSTVSGWFGSIGNVFKSLGAGVGVFKFGAPVLDFMAHPVTVPYLGKISTFSLVLYLALVCAILNIVRDTVESGDEYIHRKIIIETSLTALVEEYLDEIEKVKKTIQPKNRSDEMVDANEKMGLFARMWRVASTLPKYIPIIA